MIALRQFPGPGGPVDLDVEARDIILLRGPNGSGKTSLLHALAGLATPLAPQSVTPDLAALPARDVPARVSLSPQHALDALCGLTVAGEFRMRGRVSPAFLDALAARDVATLSSGEARRVCLAVADSGAPLLLMDEPGEGLDADGRDAARRLARSVAARGGAVVAADHIGFLDDLATRVVDLAPVEDEELPSIPAAAGPPIVGAFGPGLHAILGPNGSGKTTMLRKLAAPRARLLPPDARAILFRDSVAAELSSSDPRTVEALVPRALLPRHPLTLSGGEAQRVALAKVLGSPARAYLLDEPEAHLDGAGRVALAHVVAARVASGACVLVATHDARLAKLAQSEVRLA